MKFIIELFVFAFLRVLMALRYKIKVLGKENLNKETMDKKGGVLFLPNHPAALVDPLSVVLSVFPQFSLRPMVVEYMYFTPVVHGVMKLFRALPVPNFESSNNSLKRKRHEMVVNEMIKGLQRGENFLLYPAGRLKHTEIEKIGGASATHRIVSEASEANIVLVRVKGLWGSSFSRALTGDVPPLGPTLKENFWRVLKSCIFFLPRRQIIVEFVRAPKDFPYGKTRLEFNRWLEDWYNQPDGLSPQKGEHPGDSLQLVSYSCWRKDLPKIYEEEVEEEGFKVDNISQEVQDKVLEKLVDLTELEIVKIKPEMSLSNDLGLDSLDISDLASFLQDQFEIPPVPVTELTTVSKVLAIASGKIKVEVEREEETKNPSYWHYSGPSIKVYTYPGETIPEVFLNACQAIGEAAAYADMHSGVLKYSRLKLATLLLAEHFRHFQGRYVGILLPASVGAFLCVLACQIAGKVPVMLNWTIGPRHLASAVELSNVDVVLTSWTFLERLDQVDLGAVDDKLVMLETIKREFSFIEKLRAFYRSKLSTGRIMKIFGIEDLKGDDEAVLLFTSGTESEPKGVPLTFANILSNQRSGLEVVKLNTDDVILAFLPPFHSFGFCLTGLIGLLSGVRTVFFPDPTDGKGLAHAFEFWGATVSAGAPTFIKGMVKSATPEQLRTMRLCITGAEKTPKELIDMMERVGKQHCLIEGYGITECSPILTANIPGQPLRGVGRPLRCVDLLIVHPETHDFLPPEEAGLILAAGPNVFSGYLNPGLTPPFMIIEGREWYNTGDIGYLDEEGFLHISGRLKRFIKVGGEMVSLQALETALIGAAEEKGWSLREEGASLAVIAREVAGEKPTIFLVSTFSLTVEEVNQTLRESGFSNLVRISNVYVVEEIPLMGTGKVHYRSLEETYF